MSNVVTETYSHVKHAAEVLNRMKAEDIVILDLRNIAAFTDYFLIGSCASSKQTQAICTEIEQAFKDNGILPLHIEGYLKGNWIILDYCDFVIHIFFEDTRKYYEIERLWGDAQRIHIGDVTSEHEQPR